MLQHQYRGTVALEWFSVVIFWYFLVYGYYFKNDKFLLSLIVYVVLFLI